MKTNIIQVIVSVIIGLIICSISFLIFSSLNNQYNSMNQANFIQIIEKAKDAWIAQDGDALSEIFTPDGEMIVPGQKWQGQVKIKEEMNKFAEQYSDVKIEIKRILIENNQAAIEWSYEDTEKTTGHRNKADDVIIVDFKDDRISRWREYFDTQTPASK